MKLHFIAALVLIASLAAGCSKSKAAEGNSPANSVSAAAAPSEPAPAASGEEAAVQSAVETHLHSNAGINLAAMDMTFDSVSISGDQAQANVTFRLKQGGTSMQMSYFLDRHANGWLVMRSQPGGGQFEHPPMDKIHSGVPAQASPSSDSASGPPSLDNLLKRFPPPSKQNQPSHKPPTP